MKKALSVEQIAFLMPFFKSDKYPGWHHIATKLLTNGECIVAGLGCIWIGGIGNFIKTEPAANAVDCTLYVFDIEEFLSSEWFKARKAAKLTELAEEKAKLEEQINQLIKL